MNKIEILKEFIPFGVALTFITSLVSVHYTRKNMKTTKYIETITTERIKWLDTIRDEVSSITTEIALIITKTNQLLDILDERSMYVHVLSDSKPNAAEVLEKMDKLKTKAKDVQKEIYESGRKRNLIKSISILSLRLNYIEDELIIKKLDDTKDILSKQSYDRDDLKVLDRFIEEIVVDFRKILKSEWDKVHDEVIKGKSTKIKKKS